MAKLDEVEPGTPVLRVRVVPLTYRDAMAIYVTRYTHREDGSYVSEKLDAEGNWQEFAPFAELEPFHMIEGHITDPLQEVARQLTEMITAALFREAKS